MDERHAEQEVRRIVRDIVEYVDDARLPQLLADLWEAGARHGRDCWAVSPRLSYGARLEQRAAVTAIVHHEMSRAR